MGSWGKANTVTDSVDWAAAYVNKTANSVNKAALYANTTGGAFITNANTGVFFSTANNTVRLSDGVQHAGWVLRKSTTSKATGKVRNRMETLVTLAAPSGSDNTP